VIDLKDHPVPRSKQNGYPLAFHARVEKLIDNDRFTVWSYHWVPGKPTPMHFHDKDVVMSTWKTRHQIHHAGWPGHRQRVKFGQTNSSTQPHPLRACGHGTGSAVMTS